MIRALFFAFVALALLGDLRIFLFVLNQVVFGNHRKVKKVETLGTVKVPESWIGPILERVEL